MTKPVIQGFPPISQADARVLILGSMPGRDSLARQQYYAHARNGFWPIVSELFNLTGEDYEQKVEQLKQNRVAVWDVLKFCSRAGSLDSDIDMHTIVANDFQKFYFDHPHIRRVFFNGARAESVYLKNVLPGLDAASTNLTLKRMPSTSPAHAALSLAQKTRAWRALLDQEVD